jgi:hypothetical protein
VNSEKESLLKKKKRKGKAVTQFSNSFVSNFESDVDNG